MLPLGYRLRLDYLVEQAGYTLALAGRDGEWISRYLPAGLVEEAGALFDSVRKLSGDKRLVADESKAATSAQNRVFREAKAWRRRAANLAASAGRLGVELPQGLLVYSGATTVAALATQLEQMTTQLEENKSRLPAQATEEIIAEGRRLCAELRSQDAAQESKRLAALPRATKDLYLEKARLYLALKAINNAGRALWAEDPEKSAQYNLSILHRRTGPRKPGEDQPPK